MIDTIIKRTWLNIDFGIETCFYSEMDAYIKTLLQFVFPVYIWMLVRLMIINSNLLLTEACKVAR